MKRSAQRLASVQEARAPPPPRYSTHNATTEGFSNGSRTHHSCRHVEVGAHSVSFPRVSQTLSTAELSLLTLLLGSSINYVTPWRAVEEERSGVVVVSVVGVG